MSGEGNSQGWQRPANTGPRITGLGGSSSVGSSSGRGGFATLRDLGGGGSGPAARSFGGGHGSHDEDDEDEDEDGGKDEGESWFAGGERSGISVQNPGRPGNQPGGNLVRDLLRRAAESGPPSDPSSAAPRSSAFTGGGHTLGGDDVESTYVPDPSSRDREEETAIRHLTFWRDGFSVDDGALMRYGDPGNEAILAQIQSGHAPPHVLNVTPGQPVELRVVKRLHEDYVPTPSSERREGSVFAGTGHRLGSPVPSASSTGAGGGSDMPGSFPASSSSVDFRPPAPTSPRGAASINTRFEVDQSLPTTSIQIRLADGTRMVCRMNLTHTVGDIRNFINASRPENLTRPYTINTTFPIKTLDDDSKTIEGAGLVNSVVIQRWA